MRKQIVSVAVVAMFALTTACGASGGSDAEKDAPKTTTTTTAKPTTTTTTTPTQSVEDFAKGFCTSFEKWISQIQEAATSIPKEATPGDVESGKAAFAKLFSSASDRTQELIDGLEEAGPPDMKDGDEFLVDLVDKFEQFRNASDAAKEEAASMDTDLASFEADATRLTTAFQADVDRVGQSFSDLDKKYPSPALSKALSESCDF